MGMLHKHQYCQLHLPCHSCQATSPDCSHNRNKNNHRQPQVLPLASWQLLQATALHHMFGDPTAGTPTFASRDRSHNHTHNHNLNNSHNNSHNKHNHNNHSNHTSNHNNNHRQQPQPQLASFAQSQGALTHYQLAATIGTATAPPKTIWTNTAPAQGSEPSRKLS
jgi:hypothetical protein